MKLVENCLCDFTVCCSLQHWWSFVIPAHNTVLFFLTLGSLIQHHYLQTEVYKL